MFNKDTCGMEVRAGAGSRAIPHDSAKRHVLMRKIVAWVMGAVDSQKSRHEMQPAKVTVVATPSNTYKSYSSNFFSM